MGYLGQTFNYDCSKVGMSANPNNDAIPPESIIYPSKNINLNLGGIGKRGGTSVYNSAQISGSVSVYGYDLILRNNNQFMLAGTSDGKIVTVNSSGISATLKTGLTSGKVFNFSQMNNVAYICNGANIPQIWDGSAGSTTDIANIPTDWTGISFPQQMVKHGWGNSEEMWAFGCSSNPNTIYISADNNGTEADFSDQNVTLIYIETGDAYGIVGGIEFQSRLLAFGKKRTFIIDDSNIDRSFWGYAAAGWEGGVATHRLIVKTDNDVVCMMEDGQIYSVIAAQSAGDYKRASLTIPSYMHVWIQNNVDLSQIAKFHGIYDPVLRAIKFFVVRTGFSQPTTALVYFIDRPPEKAWVVHEGTLGASGYSASSSWLRQVSTGVFAIYTGDSDGKVWRLETINKNDNNVGYYAGIKSPDLTFENSRYDKFFNSMRVVAQAMGNYNLHINLYLDGVLQNLTPLTMNLSGAGSILDTGRLDTGANSPFVLGGIQLIDSSTGAGLKGKRLAFEIFSNTANQDFFLSRVMIDYRMLGAKV